MGTPHSTKTHSHSNSFLTTPHIMSTQMLTNVSERRPTAISPTAYQMIPQDQPSLGIVRYTLLNDHGLPQAGHYIEVSQWPSSSNNMGRAVYVAVDEVDEELSFFVDTQRHVLRTYPTAEPDQRFDITPVLETTAVDEVQHGNIVRTLREEVTELLMDLGDDTATFVLHPEDYEHSEPEFLGEMLNIRMADMRQVIF